MFSQYQRFCNILKGENTFITGLGAVIIIQKVFIFERKYLLIFTLHLFLYRCIIVIALRSDFMKIETQNINLVVWTIVIGMMLLNKERKSQNDRNIAVRKNFQFPKLKKEYICHICCKNILLNINLEVQNG